MCDITQVREKRLFFRARCGYKGHEDHFMGANMFHIQYLHLSASLSYVMYIHLTFNFHNHQHPSIIASDFLVFKVHDG